MVKKLTFSFELAQNETLSLTLIKFICLLKNPTILIVESLILCNPLTIISLKAYPENDIIVPRFNEENGFYTTKQRSKMMGKIKSKGTKAELKLRKALWTLGYRYRKNVKKLPGSPDIVFAKYRLAIFVDGEFWHGFNWEEKKLKMNTNRDFWIPKLERNMQRDRNNNRLLREKGWHVLRFWETEIKNDLLGCICKIVNFIDNVEKNSNKDFLINI